MQTSQHVYNHVLHRGNVILACNIKLNNEVVGPKTDKIEAATYKKSNKRIAYTTFKITINDNVLKNTNDLNKYD